MNAASPDERERALGSLLTPAQWLRDLGTSAWLIVGIALVTVAAVWLMALTDAIVLPLLTAGVVAAVTSPVVAWLQRRRVPRLAGAVIVLVAFIVLAIGMILLVTGGLLSQTDGVREHLAAGQDRLASALHDLGVSSSEAQSAKAKTAAAVSNAIPALLGGVVAGIGALSSVAFFLSLTVLSLIFLLKDGPAIRAWAEGHMGMPVGIAHGMTGRMLQSLRGYFVGVTAVAAFNAIVVGLGAVIVGVPLAGTIAIVTFLGAYVPYLGAWTAGIFTVVVALGGAGTDAALAMAVISLLANGVLQQMIQPIAYGAALGIHPLAVLIVTIAGGALFGGVGLILAAPLTSALTRIASDLSAARASPAPGEEAAAGVVTA